MVVCIAEPFSCIDITRATRLDEERLDRLIQLLPQAEAVLAMLFT